MSAKSSDEIVFYDLGGKPPSRCLSPNTWKTRLILNYKGIPYRTEWTEYPDIEPKLSSLGIQPNSPDAPGVSAYTLPAVVFPDGKALMDSVAIAAEIERRYPSPPLPGLPSLSSATPKVDSDAAKADPATTKTVELGKLLPGLFFPVRNILVTRVIEDLLPPRSYEYRKAKLEKATGLTLEEVKAKFDLDKTFEDLVGPTKELGAFLGKEGGPFALGEQFSWADVQLVGMLRFVIACGEDLWERLRKLDGADKLTKLYDTASQRGWLKRDTH